VPRSLNLLRGTLDGLILKSLAGGELHGYGIVDWVRNVTDGVLDIEDGALYTASRSSHPTPATCMTYSAHGL
jgi:hypothetical protein